jgi:hypothetical protein
MLEAWGPVQWAMPRPNEGRMGYPESFNEIDDWCHELRRTLVGEDIVRAWRKGSRQNPILTGCIF